MKLWGQVRVTTRVRQTKMAEVWRIVENHEVCPQPENHIDNRSYERQGLKIEPQNTRWI